jgi:hypothetical protein
VRCGPDCIPDKPAAPLNPKAALVLLLALIYPSVWYYLVRSMLGSREPLD